MQLDTGGTGTSALAAKLRSKISKFASAEDIVYPVFKEINYLTYEELKELNVRLQKMNEETPAMREKQKADALMENEMYVHAIQVYQNLLEREDLEEIREGMTKKKVPQSWLCLQLSVSDGKSYRVFSKSIRGKQEPGGTGSLLIAFGMTRTSSRYEKMAKSIGTEKEVRRISKRLQEFSKTPELVVNKTNNGRNTHQTDTRKSQKYGFVKIVTMYTVFLHDYSRRNRFNLLN